MSSSVVVAASGPACWGPLQWGALHQMSRGYPIANPTVEERAAFVAYVTALVHLLPCKFCSTHWVDALGTLTPDVTDSRAGVMKWCIDVHNAVNARLGKPVLTYPQALASIVEACPNNSWQCKASGASNSTQQSLVITCACLGLVVLVLVVLLGLGIAKRK